MAQSNSKGFRVHTGAGAPLRYSNVDTDQIIPSVYLKRVTKTGFADALFAEWREQEDFVLNDATYQDASILVAGTEFGTGSSREHAVWALKDGGFAVVIAPRFGDIFRNNSLKNGLLTIELPYADVEQLWDAIEDKPDTQIIVDLERQRVEYADTAVEFEFDEFSRWRLLEGLDDIALTLRSESLIAEYELRRPTWKPRTQAAAHD
ncbi:3-isopropylmalate dehydratase small subunit [Haloglycomyces albus]|uniref:3-isopropylmalate dehydratase small subunit n=1 Tax=Haloglycomyces albus TaxID=526067 RepID=UPI00046D8B05|nr:3-isopropylmalate dehydratase small subunit [Haloglycomyces albus]